MRITDLETPALIVDEEIMERNLARMFTLLEGRAPKLRPHYKTHKSTYIAALQIAKGAKGITCSKLSEANDLIEAGICDVLIANQVVQVNKIRRLAELAKKAKLTVCVDNAENIKMISDAAFAAQSTVNCYIELELGMNRCGVRDFESFYQLAKLLCDLPNVTYGGIQAYAGNMSHEYDRGRRESETQLNQQKLRDLITYLNERGIETHDVSGGSTGTAYLKANDDVYTELQAGSFIFMDKSYGHMELGFENALFVRATVISAREDAIVIDAGIKSLSPDQGPPRLVGYEYENISLSEEHTTFYIDHKLKVGDSVMVIPGHCCATVNLYDEMYYMRDRMVIAKRPVTSRGKAQ